MRHPSLFALLAGGALLLSACGQTDVTRAVSGVAAAEADSIRDIMLTVAEPDEAITYFKGKVQEEPRKIEHQRGLAHSLVRGGRHAEAVLAWRRVTEHDNARDADSVELADALIRTSNWADAKQVLDTIPPTHETFDRYKLEAMVADANRQWSRADSFYETAVGLTTTPASVLNNWGFSKLTRGDTEAAERLFTEAITYDSDLYTAKNNLVLARAARRTYTLPIVPMTTEERAQLLHTAGLAAIKQGDVDIGRNLLEDAIATHPRHFEPAVRALEALEA
ncbi:MAG: tetratricopeptide repeat protein [Pseudomonadota bacterium]